MSISHTIARLRKERGMTQAQLAERVYVTRQAVSRWETGESEPGVDMRKLLAGVFGVSSAQLFESDGCDVQNRNQAANAVKSVFYVCPACGNIVWSMGEIGCTCCGNPLQPLSAAQAHGEHEASIEISDGCQVVRLEHPMSKDHHIRFIACVVDDLVRIKRLYPEQDATASFFMQGPSMLFAFCSEHGLFRLQGSIPGR